MSGASRAVGLFDLFRIGLGPSSSHTVGPMHAAADFAAVALTGLPDRRPAEVRVELFGSLAATGAGHGTFAAILVGLEGCRPDRVMPEEITARVTRIERDGALRLGDTHLVRCSAADFALAPGVTTMRHPNAMRFAALDDGGRVLCTQTSYSVGGGFVERDDEPVPDPAPVPWPFTSAQELVALCENGGGSIADVVRANELVSRTPDELRSGVLEIWASMQACIDAGIARDGTLPGGLAVRRRAGALHAHLERNDPQRRPEFWQEWVNLVALAVNEENASGGRVVTAPTNGAAGIVPAVLFYALTYTPRGHAAQGDVARGDVVEEFLLTACAVGALVKANASISGAEVGCQGEVGTASAMAAAGLAAVLGGTVRQVENAAEIAMEHNLGLTCDPIGGLVQVPCIERNAIAASKAVNAARMALWGDGTHTVSLDQVIRTMRETGADMNSKYKETSRGGLAVNVVNC